MPKFGTDGIRGVANKEITADLALAVANAAMQVFDSSAFFIGRDTRVSGAMLEAAMVAGITANGINVELLGETTTPCVAWASCQEKLPGIMISASHNPYTDNGIKIFAPGGLKLSDDHQNKIQNIISEQENTMFLSSDDFSTGFVRESNSVTGWENSIVNSVANIDLSDFKVVLDCANGSSYKSAPRVFQEIGIDTVIIGDKPDGLNINKNYGSTDIHNLKSKVIETKADIGLAFDGDADRLIAVDSEGKEVDGDHLIVILANDFKSRGVLANDKVVVTVMSNLGLYNALAQQKIHVVTTKVGDRYVLEALDEQGLSLGGEQSGHIICRDLATTGDGVLAGVQLLAAIKRSGQSFADLANDCMKSIPQILKNVKFDTLPNNLEDQMADDLAKINEDFGDQGRVLIRLSGTEPVVRVMVEHSDPARAQNVSQLLVEKIQNIK